MLKKITKWIFSNKREFFFLILLIILSGFLRFYQINKLSFFTYDQARDALFMKRILVDHKFRLIGTQSSIPGLYTGPAYYYLMAPFLFVFRLSPAGIDFGTAIMGFLSVFLLYFLLKLLTKNCLLSFLISAWYSTQPQVLAQSRFSWNPNPMPFFVLLFLLSLFKVLGGLSRWWVFAFFSLAVILQLHYSGLCLIPVLFIVAFYYRRRITLNRWFYFSLAMFTLMMSPLFFFELRHGFSNSKAIFEYFRHGIGGGIPPPPFVQGFYYKLKFILSEMPYGINNGFFSAVVVFISLLSFVYIFLKKKIDKESFFIIFFTLVLGVLTASLYQGSFFNFYLTFLYPIGFLISGMVFGLFANKKAGKMVLIIFSFVIISVNLKASLPFLERTNKEIKLKEVASLIAKDVDEKNTFNLVAIYKENDRFDRNAVDYRYFLEAYEGKKALDWDVLDYQKSDVLYFISDEEVNPVGFNIWEVELFSPNKILDQWKTQSGTFIYKLSKKKN